MGIPDDDSSEDGKDCESHSEDVQHVRICLGLTSELAIVLHACSERGLWDLCDLEWERMGRTLRS